MGMDSLWSLQVVSYFKQVINEKTIGIVFAIITQVLEVCYVSFFPYQCNQSVKL